MKWVKVFIVFIALHLMGWLGAHWYKNERPIQVLLIADTSYALKSEYPAMQSWIESFSNDNRYQNIIVGTDKALRGNLAEVRSIDSLFRVSFGRSSAESLKQYESMQVDERIFLSDGEFSPAGWTLVRFP